VNACQPCECRARRTKCWFVLLALSLQMSASCLHGAAPPITKELYVLRIENCGVRAKLDIRNNHFPALGILMGTSVRPYAHVSAVAALLPFTLPLGSLVGVLELDYTDAIQQLTDADMDWVSQCPFLEVLAFEGSGISDDGLRRLRRVFPRLRTMHLGKKTKITDAGLVELRQCRSLEALSLPWDITDLGLEHLVNLTSLRRLDLRVRPDPGQALVGLHRPTPGPGHRPERDQAMTAGGGRRGTPAGRHR